MSQNQDPPQNPTPESNALGEFRYYRVEGASAARQIREPIDLSPGAVYIVDDVELFWRAEGVVSMGLRGRLPEGTSRSNAGNFGRDIGGAADAKKFYGKYEDPQMHIVTTEGEDVKAFTKGRELLEGTQLVTVVYAVDLVSSSGTVPAGARVTYGLVRGNSKQAEASGEDRPIYVARQITDQVDTYWQAWLNRRRKIGADTTRYALSHMCHAGAPGLGKDA